MVCYGSSNKDLGGVTFPHLQLGRWLPVPSSEILVFIICIYLQIYYTVTRYFFQLAREIFHAKLKKRKMCNIFVSKVYLL